MRVQSRVELENAEKTSGMTTEWISDDGDPDLVSIVVPTHNRRKLLCETLECLIAQTYGPIQIVVVDDGSTDDTSEHVSRFAEECSDGREIVYARQDPAGGPAARNRGARLTRGEFLLFMDDDDLVPNRFVECRVEALKTNPAAKIAFGVWHIFEVVDGKYRILSTRGRLPTGADFDWFSFIDTKWQLLLQGCILRRDSVVQAGPWREDLYKSQDLEYKARLLIADWETVFVDEEPVYYRMHKSSISGKHSEDKMDSYADVIDQLEAMTVERADYEPKKERLAECLWTHSFWLYGAGEFKRSYRHLRRAKVHDENICRKKGFFPTVLDTLGMDFVIGPAYYAISQCKKSLGFSPRRVLAIADKLPIKEHLLFEKT